MRSISRRPTRRHVLLAVSAAVVACARPARAPPAGARSPDDLAEIEHAAGGRAGVYALDTASGRDLAHRPDERFAMCSTFKWFLAAALLARADAGEIALAAPVPYGPGDLVDHAPTTTANVARGAMPAEDLARATIANSDNTAANLLLARVGGPAGLTELARRLGDPVTRFDRIEPALNENAPGDPRDTTSPRAMVGLLRAVLCGGALSPAARDRLLGWMIGCETGRDRLRAGLPAGWTVGDKTGTGDRGALNDVAIAFPPARPPILIAAYLSDADTPPAARIAAQAAVGRLVARSFG